jgi:cell division protein FtsB|tara:strand:- start:845 stop:1141 length:297 start_codon:yes stop_codon:yes gene_type:complete
MRFIEIINQKRFIFFTIFLFLYALLNLLIGERGLISYYDKQKVKHELVQKKNNLTLKLASIEKKNSLLTNELDLDYLETLYRKKFMLGKPNEYIYKVN